MYVKRVLFGVLSVLAIGSSASAQHSDIEVGVVGGALDLEQRLYESEFGEVVADYSDEPGFEVDDGVMNEDDVLGFDVVDSLLYWDGTQFAPSPNGEYIDIEGAGGFLGPVSVTNSSGSQSGFDFGLADEDGGIHTHLDFYLIRPGSVGFPQSPAPAVGAYGLWLELTSPQYATSESFIIMINNGLGEEQFEAGVDAAAALVPEPTTLLLAGMGAAAWMRQRRRRIA